MESRTGTLVQLERRMTVLRLRTSALALSIALKAGFKPSQLRVPRGRPDGGQWTREGGSGLVHLVSRRRPGGNQIRIQGRWLSLSPGQQQRLLDSHNAMRAAVQHARRLDPAWKPPAQAFETVNGLISANRSIELAARFRIFELTGTRAALGPYAKEYILAPQTNRRLRRAEQAAVDRLGRKWGCHRCGRKDPGEGRTSFIGDHQVPKSIGTPTRIYPHCAGCSASQGGLLNNYLRRRPE